MRIALKIDVDTYRGIENGAARLASYLRSRKIPASIFVSLGPDNSGWAATRLFRHKGFFQKMRRTSAVSVYGWRTVLSGTLLPARPMGVSFPHLLRQWREWGFEVSPHGFDHILWHDQAARWNPARAAQEMAKTTAIYHTLFGEDPRSFAAPGWQAGEGTWTAMEPLNLLYHSDSRGTHPFFPKIGDNVLSTLEIPTTLPTWDEMLAWEGVTRETLVENTWSRLYRDRLNVWTIHAEFEGTGYFPPFHDFVDRAAREGVEWVSLAAHATELLHRRSAIPCATIEPGSLPGRAGTVTCQITHG